MIFQRAKSPKYCPKPTTKPLILAGLWVGFAGIASLETLVPVLAAEVSIPESAPAAHSEAAPEAAPPLEAAPVSAPPPVSEAAAATIPAPAPAAPVQDYYAQPRAPQPQAEPETYRNPPPVQAQSDPYIDTKDYSVGATQPYTPPESVIVRERSSGCQATSGQALTAGLCGAPSAQQPYALPSRSDGQPPAWASVPKRWDAAPDRWSTGANPEGWGASPSLRGGAGVSAQASAQTVQNTLQYTVAAPHNLSVKPITGANPLKWILPSGEHMIFPLPIPVVITSVFGWRLHPITGKWSFHSGTDLGAPMGTPVLAAYSGRVGLAEFMGGYGLSILLDHGEGSRETRYAHLSELFVKPGQWVQQGTVIGLVGSTGNSTGPHLHFEALQSVQGTLVAVDPGLELQTTLGQLATMLKTARLTTAKASNAVPSPTTPNLQASVKPKTSNRAALTQD